jgi:hypothetical protein
MASPLHIRFRRDTFSRQDRAIAPRIRGR